jgi:superfamily I DNA and/or RNA helicase
MIGLRFTYLKSINVIGATCIHIASMKYGRVDFKFDYVIMDESSKASPAEALVPINMGRNIILIGDHKQLPPVVTREEAVKQKVRVQLEDNGLDIDKEFGESLFEKIILTIEMDPQKAQLYRMLDIQYRMPRQVGTLISKYFYEGKLRNPDPTIVPRFDGSKSHGLELVKKTNMVFLSTSKDENPYDNGDKFARANKCNLRKIKEALEWLNNAYPANLQRKNEKGEPAPFTIGIIAGYRGQVSLLQKEIALTRYRNFITQDENGNEVPLIRINTVDKFQGAEEDIIIYDVVKSSHGNDTIGFLSDYRRINVALSRVKKLLIIVGDSEYLLKRASLPNDPRFPEFKLKMITEEFQQQSLIIHDLKDLLPIPIEFSNVYQSS